MLELSRLSQAETNLAASWASFPSQPDPSYREYSVLFLVAFFLLCVETGGDHSTERGQSEEEVGQKGTHRIPRRNDCDLTKLLIFASLPCPLLLKPTVLPVTCQKDLSSSKWILSLDLPALFSSIDVPFSPPPFLFVPRESCSHLRGW